MASVSPDAKIILYGSRARGNARQDSDWDLPVVLNNEKIEATDSEAISYPMFELGLPEGQLFSTKQYTPAEWEERRFTPFYKNVEKEGIKLCV